MQNVLFELILTNNCNKRCQYCDLEFKNKSMTINDLDLFIDFIKNNNAQYIINFFWWEPLLMYNEIKYFVEKSDKYVNKYFIWTNWFLLDYAKLEYFIKNKIKIHLSIDNIKWWEDIDLELISKYKDNIIINFINDPDYIKNSITIYDKIINYWFKNIAFMPVFSSKKWNNKSLLWLKQLYNHISKNNNWINLEIYSYFNGISVDKQFILDTNLYFYSDIDSLLWLQKQYKVIPDYIKKEIDKKTKLLSLKDKNISLNNLINIYNIEEIVKLIFEIPKKTWDYITYSVIDKIFENDSKKRE